jgi:hypothetical protein
MAAYRCKNCGVVEEFDTDAAGAIHTQCPHEHGLELTESICAITQEMVDAAVAGDMERSRQLLQQFGILEDQFQALRARAVFEPVPVGV